MLDQAHELTVEDIDIINQDLEDKSPQEILAWAFEKFAPDIVTACSFGGGSGMVLVDMAAQIYPDLKVFYLDTDLLFPETYALRDQVARRYNISPVAFKSLITLDEQAAKYGDALWSRDPDLCCDLRKVEPNQRALKGEKAWISGLRRDQSPTRRDMQIVAWDTQFNLIKLAPLVAWTEAQVMDYVHEHNVPYNSLYDQGYLSIGCIHCTRAVKLGEDPRAGRWAGTDKIECGIHLPGMDIDDPVEQETAGGAK